MLHWIRGCAGLKCEIPTYEQKPFTNEIDCNSALELWIELSPKVKQSSTLRGNEVIITYNHTGQHVGICVER